MKNSTYDGNQLCENDSEHTDWIKKEQSENCDTATRTQMVYEQADSQEVKPFIDSLVGSLAKTKTFEIAVPPVFKTLEEYCEGKNLVETVQEREGTRRVSVQPSPEIMLQLIIHGVADTVEKLLETTRTPLYVNLNHDGIQLKIDLTAPKKSKKK